MSQIAPDIPELEHVHEVIRSLVWTRALMRAIRSPATQLMGLACCAAGAFLGGVAGLQTLGWLGALAGGLLGTMAAVYFFLKVLLQHRARRLVQVVEKEVDWSSECGEVMRAHDRIKAVASRTSD